MFFTPTFVTLSALVAFASALTGPKILLPTADRWWVAQSNNVLTWDCTNSQVTQFAVYITNKDPKILQGNLAIFVRLDNTVCSKEITEQQVTQPAATGYTILFTNIANQTEVYSQSDEFEIKPLGSADPQTSSVGPFRTFTPAGPSSTGTAASPSDADTTASPSGTGIAASSFGTDTTSSPSSTGITASSSSTSNVVDPSSATATSGPPSTGTPANPSSTGTTARPSSTSTTAGSSSSSGSGGNNGAFSHKFSLGYGLAAVGALVGLIAA